MFKFNLGDKVFITPYNRPGIIVCSNATAVHDVYNITYDVRYKAERETLDHGYGLIECVGTKYVTVNAKESELVLSLSETELIDLTEKMSKYIAEKINQVFSNAFVGTPLPQGLDTMIGFLGVPSKILFPNEIKECDHSWAPYQGLSENYDFCTKCDVKNKP